MSRPLRTQVYLNKVVSERAATLGQCSLAGTTVVQEAVSTYTARLATDWGSSLDVDHAFAARAERSSAALTPAL